MYTAPRALSTLRSTQKLQPDTDINSAPDKQDYPTRLAAGPNKFIENL